MTVQGSLSDQAIEQLAELLLGAGMICELCGQRPPEHFGATPWGDRHCCTPCWESLQRPDQETDVDAAAGSTARPRWPG